jgi:hypothetical protein
LNIAKVHYISTLKHNIKNYDKKTNPQATTSAKRVYYFPRAIHHNDVNSINANQLKKHYEKSILHPYHR